MVEGIETQDRLAEIKARHEAATKGPYQWRGWAGNDRTLYLVSAAHQVVMDFWRWTKREQREYSYGIPAFNVEGVLTSAAEMFRTRVHHPGMKILDIDHPDAIALRSSWEDREWLIGEVERLRGELKDTMVKKPEAAGG